jgi:hypothetical protein
MPYGPGTYGPDSLQSGTDLAALPEQEKKAALRKQGIPEALIDQILALSLNDPSGLNKQYDMSAYIRRGAFTPQQTTSVPGAIAQGLAGGIAGHIDKNYAKAIRDYEGSNVRGRKSLLGAMFPGKKSTSNAFDYRPEIDYTGIE